MMDVRLVPVPIAAGVPPIDALQLPNGRRGATIRSLCKVLDIAANMQVARIRRNPKLSQALVVIEVSTPGGPQQADVLVSWAIPIWVAGLSVSRLSEAKQPVALILQQEAFAAIEQAFAQPEKNAPASEPLAAEAPLPVIDKINRGFSLLTEGLTTLATGQQRLDERVTALEGGPTGSIIGFSPQRLAHVYMLARQVRTRHRLRISETLTGLADHFRVEDVSDLPEKDWPAILDWFSSLLEEWQAQRYYG